MDIAVEAPYVCLVDYDTGSVLLERRADELIHPSSMTKIMTAYLAFDALKSGHLKPDTLLTVTREGWRVEGSSMFLNIGDQVKVEDLLRGIIIQSGNDASTILGIAMHGSEAAAASVMTRKAKELGALHTNFVNLSGLPHENHLTTSRDLVTISLRVLRDFPEYYPMFSEKEFSYNNIKQGNRNPLLYTNMGATCDGIKTGHSDIAGFGMVASCHLNGQRLVLVMNGLGSMQKRADEARKLITWGLKTFQTLTLYQSQQVVEMIPVLYGSENTLPLTTQKDIMITYPRALQKDLQITLYHPSAVEGPIAKGQVLGKIVVKIPGKDKDLEVPLVAAIGIECAGFMKTLYDSIHYLLWGIGKP